MMKQGFLSVGAAVALMGCDVAQPAVDQAARDAAKSVITPIVTARVPGANADIVTNCVIDNATGAQILDLAKAAVIGVTEDTTQTILEIAREPDTVKCIAEDSLSRLVGG